MEEIWQARIKLKELSKTAKDGDTYLGDSGFWEFKKDKWVTIWVRVQGRLIKGEEYERDEQEDLVGYDLRIPTGNI